MEEQDSLDVGGNVYNSVDIGRRQTKLFTADQSMNASMMETPVPNGILTQTTSPKA